MANYTSTLIPLLLFLFGTLGAPASGHAASSTKGSVSLQLVLHPIQTILVHPLQEKEGISLANEDQHLLISTNSEMPDEEYNTLYTNNVAGMPEVWFTPSATYVLSSSEYADDSATSDEAEAPLLESSTDRETSPNTTLTYSIITR